jgi:hypothetical protein
MSDSPSFDPDHTARFVSERTGGFYRGSGEILPGGDFSPAELEHLKTIKTYDGFCKWLRARAYGSRERLDAYIENNPERVKAKKIRHDRKTRERNYLTNEFVAVDFEGQDYLNNVIYRENNRNKPTPYDDHRLFLGGAASSDENRAPEWLINPETTDDDKRPLDPRAVLDWLVNLPSKYSDGAIFVMFSFSYDVTHILRHLRFSKAWEIFKEEKYDRDRKKRRKIHSRVFCGEPFDEFVMKYRNRKQLDIWKLRDPEYPYLRDEDGGYVLKKDGQKKLDTIAHITLFDTHPFYQQSFVKAMSFLVKTGKADKADFEYMEEMKKKRGRFSLEPLAHIKHYTTLELRYLALGITDLRNILHDIKLDCAPDMKPIHISNWYGPGAVAGAVLKNLDIIKNHYGDDIRAVDPLPVQVAAHHAFSAGRIELPKVGHAPDLDLHSIDEASAYPHSLTQLPSLAGGKWDKIDDRVRYKTLAELKAIIEASSIVSMFYLDYQFPLYEHFDGDVWKRIYVPWYPLFFRSRRGAIFYPRRGEGWYMRDDALAAVEWLERFAPVAKWRDDGTPITKRWEIKDTRFVVKQAWIFTPRDASLKPFAFLKEIYRQRMKYKFAVPYDAREKFYKLPPNSIYGKMAQRVGGSETKDGWKAPSTANPYYAAAITANCRRRLVEAGLLDPHSVVAFMTDGIVTMRRLEALPNVVDEGDPNTELGDWEYTPVQGGTFLHAGVYSMRKGGEESTKTRGVDPKRVSPNEAAGRLLVAKALEAMEKEYHPNFPIFISLPIRDLVTIGQALMACENKRDMWAKGLAGRWAPPIDSPNALHRAINLDKLGGKRRWIPGREDAWQTRRRPDGTVRLANRCVTLVSTIPAENPEPEGTRSAMYKPDWIDPELGESIEESDEQEAIQEGMF